jgi:micrococcal nuclease
MWSRVLAFVGIVAIGTSACSNAGRAGPPEGLSDARGGSLVPVTKVVDGDTIHVAYGGRDERVRLIGVDTPEVPWYGGHGECYGVQAGEFVKSRLTGRWVRLVFDRDLRDRYDRLLAYVYLGKELFNLTLVRLGYAEPDPVPPDTRLASIFARAANAAKAAGRGLWLACSGEGVSGP